ncbi:hypothetical protein ACLOJK_024040, partial [Asimina triloba]
ETRCGLVRSEFTTLPSTYWMAWIGRRCVAGHCFSSAVRCFQRWQNLPDLEEVVAVVLLVVSDRHIENSLEWVVGGNHGVDDGALNWCSGGA